jgi:hypothetical protein
VSEVEMDILERIRPVLCGANFVIPTIVPLPSGVGIISVGTIYNDIEVLSIPRIEEGELEGYLN